MHLPDFLLIGSGKSGTTSIYHALKQHPEIYMSPIKEPNFFALEGATKINGYDQDDPEGFNFYPWAVTDWEDYQELFSNAKKDQIKGEASTIYQYSKEAPFRIKERLPNVKLIAIFRQPAERLYSRYLHLARENREPTKEFEDCLEKGNIWWKKNDLIHEGFYHQHMKRYFELFPKEQIKIFLYEDLRENSEKMMKELFEFLGADPACSIDMSMRHNPSGFIKNPILDKFIGQKSILKNYLGSLSPRLLDNIKRSKFAQKWLLNLRKKNLNRPPLSKETRHSLTGEVYRDDILRFQDLIGRDLSHWLRA